MYNIEEQHQSNHSSVPRHVGAGEALWVARIIRKHHTTAAEAGTKIVHCCAYDSIPADLGTLLLVKHIRRALNRSADCVVCHLLPVTATLHDSSCLSAKYVLPGWANGATFADMTSHIRSCKALAQMSGHHTIKIAM